VVDDDCAFLFNLVVERPICFLFTLLLFSASSTSFVTFFALFLSIRFYFGFYGRQLLVVVVDIVIPNYPAPGDG